jgi:hypothetical protein
MGAAGGFHRIGCTAMKTRAFDRERGAVMRSPGRCKVRSFGSMMSVSVGEVSSEASYFEVGNAVRIKGSMYN